MESVIKDLKPSKPTGTVALFFQNFIGRHFTNGDSPIFMHDGCMAVIFGIENHTLIWTERAWRQDELVNQMSETICLGIKCFRFKGHMAENEEFREFIYRHFKKR